MLSKRRDERPESFAEIKQQLLGYIDVSDNQTAPPEHIVAGGMEPIHATSFEQAAAVEPGHFPSAGDDYAPNTSDLKNQPTVSARSATIALALAVVAVGLVVFLLPRFAPTVTPDLSRNTNVEGNENFGEVEPGIAPTPDIPASASKENPQGEETTTLRAPYEEATFQRERSEAQDFTLSLLRRQMALEDKKVTVWAPEEYKKAQALGDHGDALFREERFGEAMDSYYDAETVLIELSERADGVLEELLTAGKTAIDALDQDTAEEAFEAVLRIDAANAQAITGLEITEALPTIAALLESGDAKLRADELRDARSDYDEVLKIYPGNQVAIDARQEINQRLADIRFESIMSQGYAAVAVNDYETARAAFERARKMRPNARGPKDGLAQVDVSIKGGSIEQLRAEARKLERLEQWSEAAKQYQAALDVDDSLTFAKQGKFRALARSRLNNQLESYIQDSQKLSNQAVFAKAQDVLAPSRKTHHQRTPSVSSDENCTSTVGSGARTRSSSITVG